MTLPAIKALLIDLDDTLFPESAWVDSGLRAAALALAGETGLDTEEALARLRYEHRRMGRTGAFDRACAWFKISPAPVDIMLEAYRSHAPALRLYPGAAEALEMLRPRFRLAVVTDGMGQMQRTKAAALRIAQRVDEIVFCWDEEGCAKPAPGGFALAAQRLGVAPEECLVVGDDPYLDGLAAGALGASFCRVLSGRFVDVEAGPAPMLRIQNFADLPAALGIA
jgi:putative hydrolase of the HAD superfamily